MSDREMIINRIEHGIVIDHLKCGSGNKIIKYLDINLKKDTIALIMNIESKKYGKKDIVKIRNLTDVDMHILSIIDSSATVNIIQDGKIVEKRHAALPQKTINVLKCTNPRCVTSIESTVKHCFHLVDEKEQVYRCEYCDDQICLKDGSKYELVHN